MKITASRFHVVQVGCGGTGSYVFYYLSRLMFTELSREFDKRTTVLLIDGDSVEMKNTLRQNFIENDVGRNKARVLAERYSNAYGIHVEYRDEMIDNPDLLENLLGYTNRPFYGIVLPILVGCVDNHLARRVMHTIFEDHEGPLIYIDAGNSETTGQAIIGVKGRMLSNDAWGYSSTHKTDISALPAGSVLPSLLEPEEKNGRSLEGLSCADLTLLDGQSIMANMATANLVNIALNSIINHKRVPFHLATVNILTGETKTAPIRLSKDS